MRKIPFEANLIGNLSKNSYLNSKFVFVTILIVSKSREIRNLKTENYSYASFYL